MIAPPEMTFADLRQAVLDAMQTWNAPENRQPELWLRLQLIKAKRQPDEDDNAVSLHQAINEALQQGLDNLAQQNPPGHAALIQQYLEGATRKAIAVERKITLDQFRGEQGKALDSLTAIMQQLEEDACRRKVEDDFAQMEPSTYSDLFGVAEVCQKLAAALLAPGPPWVAAVAGIGGIGKTAVADAVVRQIIQQRGFAETIWLRVSAPTLGETSQFARLTLDKLILQIAQRFGLPLNSPLAERSRQVQRLLKTLPCLVIIDNLEAGIDAAFLTHLHNLANPSKFLLTTRTLPPVQAAVWRFALPELSLPEATALIRHEASRLGQADHLANIDDQLAHRIYEKVGGNPLALKLVVGLSYDFQDFDLVIDDLTTAHLPDIDALYRHIYWKAWHTLSANARLLLERMPLAADIGMLEDQMKGISGLDKGNLLAAVHELIKRSLLEVRGAASQPRYGIHPLTRSFILTDIIHWPQ